MLKSEQELSHEATIAGLRNLYAVVLILSLSRQYRFASSQTMDKSKQCRNAG